MSLSDLDACAAVAVDPEKFNQLAKLPYGLTIDSLVKSMREFTSFLSFINQQLHTQNIPRMECFLMAANFSSIVGEFMSTTIPKHCPTLVKNRYHNGHPDLVPQGLFLNDSVSHATEGIEIKGSRHPSGWQGHNPENIWLLVFTFKSNTATEFQNGQPNKSFQFSGVYAAKLDVDDWTFSGRSETSRRTITASVNREGNKKMIANWVYKD